MSPLVPRPRWSRTPCALDGRDRLWCRPVVVDELAAPRRRGRPTRRAGSRVLPVYRARYCIREGSSRLLDGSTVSCFGEPSPDLLVAKTPRLCPEVVAACEGDDETQPAHSPRCTATPAHSPRCTATLCHARTRQKIRVRRYRRRATADLLFGRVRTRAAWLACDCHLYAPNSIVC